MVGSRILTRAPMASMRYFSGIGTVELASGVFAAAAAVVLWTFCRLQPEVLPHAELRHVVPGASCIFEEFLARAPVAAQLMAEAQTRGVLDFDAARKKFLKAGLRESGGKVHAALVCRVPYAVFFCACFGVAMHTRGRVQEGGRL